MLKRLTFTCRDCEETEEWVSKLAARLHGWSHLHTLNLLDYMGLCALCERDRRVQEMRPEA